MDDEAETHAESHRNFFRRVEVRVPADQHLTIDQSMLDSSHMDIEYSSLLLPAGLIALFRLLENSAAVTIGAMLLFPLMNLILSAALAPLLGDGKMGKHSLHCKAVNAPAYQPGLFSQTMHREALSFQYLRICWSFTDCDA